MTRCKTFYNWDKNRSSDPNFNPQDPVIVRCDGVECRDILYCEIGPNGIVIMVDRGATGVIKTNGAGTEILRKSMTGNVEVTFHRKEERHG